MLAHRERSDICLLYQAKTAYCLSHDSTAVGFCYFVQSRLLLPISGTSPKTCSKHMKSCLWDPRGTRPSCGTPTRGDPDTPQVPDHPQVPNPLSCTEVTMGPKNTGRRRKREPRKRTRAARRVWSGQAWHAGDTRLGTPHAALLPKLRPPFSMTYGR